MAVREQVRVGGRSARIQTAVHDATRVAGTAGQAGLGRLRGRKQGNARDA